WSDSSHRRCQPVGRVSHRLGVSLQGLLGWHPRHTTHRMVSTGRRVFCRASNVAGALEKELWFHKLILLLLELRQQQAAHSSAATLDRSKSSLLAFVPATAPGLGRMDSVAYLWSAFCNSLAA